MLYNLVVQCEFGISWAARRRDEAFLSRRKNTIAPFHHDQALRAKKSFTKIKTKIIGVR
jgi:hypothetical protein